MMRFWNSRSRLAAALLVAVLAGAVARAEETADVPDLSGFWMAKHEANPTGQELIEQLPKNAVFINDAGGRELGIGDFAGLQLSDRAKEEISHYNYKDELNPGKTCIDPSVIGYMQAPFPMEIHQDTRLIVFAMEYFDMYRIVFLDGRPHPPKDAPHTKSGHSIGHWEGDTLVVDTTHILAASITLNGLNHSDNIHMVERFRKSPDGQTLWATQVYDDPEIFAGLGARYIAWRSVPGEHIYPYECDPHYGEK